MGSGKKNRNQRKNFDSRSPGLLRIDQGWMGQSIGKCKENSKPEKYLTAEDQGRKQKTRDRVRGGWDLLMGSGKKNQNQRKNFDRRRPG